MMRLMRQYGDWKVTPEVRRRIAARRDFGVGDVARVVEGPFEGQKVRVIDIKGQTAKAMLNIMSGNIQMEIKTALLSKDGESEV